MNEQQKTACERMMTALGKAIWAEDINEVQRCLQFVAVGVSSIQEQIYQESTKREGNKRGMNDGAK